jgi:hypothetical protein
MFSVCRSQGALRVEILASTPDRCAPALRQETAEVDRGGSCLLGMVVRSLGRLEIRACHRQTRDGHCLAPERVPVVLDLEGSARNNRKARRLAGGPGSDPYHEPCEPAVGCAAQRIHGELLKLGIDIGETSVSKYMVRQ